VIPINEIRITGFREGKSLEMEYKLPERPLLPGNAPEQAAAATGDAAVDRASRALELASAIMKRTIADESEE